MMKASRAAVKAQACAYVERFRKRKSCDEDTRTRSDVSLFRIFVARNPVPLPAPKAGGAETSRKDTCARIHRRALDNE
jgi:hypothetical protein